VTLLVDTNIFLEVLLAQDRMDNAKRLLAHGGHERYVSDFSLHSVGIVMFRKGMQAAFWQFWQDMVLSGAVRVCSVVDQDMATVVEAGRRFGLDFDDAYQYAIAEQDDLTIVSFDSHFDQTERGRRTPAEILGA
jgi:predicted nucleic acid-binding protein